MLINPILIHCATVKSHNLLIILGFYVCLNISFSQKYRPSRVSNYIFFTYSSIWVVPVKFNFLFRKKNWHKTRCSFYKRWISDLAYVNILDLLDTINADVYITGYNRSKLLLDTIRYTYVFILGIIWHGYWLIR